MGRDGNRERGENRGGVENKEDRKRETEMETRKGLEKEMCYKEGAGWKQGEGMETKGIGNMWRGWK